MIKDMKADFDFNKTGKRMPYTVPEGFFDEMEDRIRKEVFKEPAAGAERRFFPVRMAARVVAAVAAAVALLVVIDTRLTGNGTADSPSIERAFNRLCNEDQTYLLETYQDDIFMNE